MFLSYIDLIINDNNVPDSHGITRLKLGNPQYCEFQSNKIHETQRTPGHYPEHLDQNHFITVNFPNRSYPELTIEHWANRTYTKTLKYVFVAAFFFSYLGE